MKTVLSEPRWVDSEVEIPEQCPGCAADLTKPRAVTCWQWCATEAVVSPFDGDPSLAEVDSVGGRQDFENLHEEQYQCAECKRQLGKPAPAEGVEPMSTVEQAQATHDAIIAAKRLAQNCEDLRLTILGYPTLSDCRERVLDLVDQARQMLSVIGGNAEASGK